MNLPQTWIAKNDQYFERIDGCYVWYDISSPYPNPEKPSSRLWVAYLGEHYKESYLSKNTPKTKLLIPRRFKTAEAAIKALEKEYPL